MTYLTLSAASKVVDWARSLIVQLVQRDAALDKRLKAIEDRLDAGGL